MFYYVRIRTPKGSVKEETLLALSFSGYLNPLSINKE